MSEASEQLQPWELFAQPLGQQEQQLFLQEVHLHSAFAGPSSGAGAGSICGPGAVRGPWRVEEAGGDQGEVGVRVLGS